ncbi:KAP family P-loop NTPase fold protein [Amycolatopsis sp. NPDC003731]
MRLPDRDASNTVLIGPLSTELAAVLTDSQLGPAFDSDRCLILPADPQLSEAVSSLAKASVQATDTFLVYSDSDSISVNQRAENVVRGSRAGTRVLIQDARYIAASTNTLPGVLVIDTSTLAQIIQRMREGMPGEGELLSLKALTGFAGTGNAPSDIALARNIALFAALADDYDSLKDTARKLLRRTALLTADEALDLDFARVLLPGVILPAVEQAWLQLRKSMWLNWTTDDGLVFRTSEVHSAARQRLASEESGDVVEQLRSALRAERAVRAGIAPRPQLSRDFWTVEDRLDYRLHADAVAAFIKHRDSVPPLTIGVTGQCGAGKTSLMRMIRAQLDPPEADRPRRIELTQHSRATLAKRRWWRRQATPDRGVSNDELLQHASAPAGEEIGAATPAPEVAAPSAAWRATVWFNPWMYQSTEQVWAGLADAIVTQVTDRLRPGDRERFWLQLNLARVDRLAVRRRIHRLVLERVAPWLAAFVVAAVAAGVVWAVGLGTELARWVLAGGAGVVTVGSVFGYVVGRGQRAITAFTRLLSGPTAGAVGTDAKGVADAAFSDLTYTGKAGFLHVVQADMPRVLRLVATPERPLVVFIDDLDRCSPGVVAQVIEAINLFLAGEFENCVFVLAIEPDVVAAHVEVAYAELIEKLPGTEGTLGWRFHRATADEPAPGAAPPVTPVEPGIALGAGTKPTPGGPVPTPTDVPAELAVEWAEAQIRAFKPTLATMPAIVGGVESHLRSVSAVLDPHGLISYPIDLARITELVEIAADRVYLQLHSDAYTDATAFTALEAALPGLRSANPREIKRYVNLFRFYSFLTVRRRGGPDGPELAKLAVLAIRWPDLLSTLTKNQSAVLCELETAAAADDAGWEHALTETGCLVEADADRRAALRDFLTHGPPIADDAHALL